MSSLADDKLPWFQAYLARLLSNGPIPNHVAFILDGNRRWAREKGLDVIAGHKFGAQIGAEVVNFLREVGVKEVTLYLFSIENFHRNEKDVDNLMCLLRESLDDIVQDTKNAVLQFVGDKKLLSKEIREKMEHLEQDTKENTGVIVNVALAYTCRDDITHSMKGVLKKGLDSEDITVKLLGEHLYTSKFAKNVDILIRTSGETRLSDFLLWETSNAWICFLDKLWPELNYWDVTRCILKYQRLIFNQKLTKCD